MNTPLSIYIGGNIELRLGGFRSFCYLCVINY